MADKWKEALKRDMEANKGKAPEEMISSIGMFGSGQWLVWEATPPTAVEGGFRSTTSTRTRATAWPRGCGLHAHVRHGRADGLL